jgi:uncharacterized delta-60 repeat protein
MRKLVVRWLLTVAALISLAGPARANAAFDKTFNGDGIFIPDQFGGIDDLALDGTSIVATGYIDVTPPAAFAAFRVTADGQLDSSFSGDGVFTLPGYGGRGVGIVPRTDGGYWVGGWVRLPTLGANEDFALVSLTSAGEVDTTFGGGDGLVSVDLGGDDAAESMTVDPSGRIVLAGRSVDPNGATSSDIAVVRFTSAGQPDTAFGGDGGVTYSGGAGEFDDARGIATTGTGQPIVVGASTSSADGSSQLVLVRLEEDGDLDPTFGEDGLALPDLAVRSAGSAIEALPNGKILVGGTASGAGASSGFAVARVRTDGSLDGSFGQGGKGYTVVDLGASEEVEGLATMSDGSIVLAGNLDWQLADHAVVRFTRQGLLDPLFGKKITNLWSDQFGNDSDDLVMAFLVMPDDRYVVAGTSWVGLNGLTGYRVSIARYRSPGKACTKVGTTKDDIIRGTTSADVLCGLGGDDEIAGFGGADRIYGGSGNDSLFGGGGNDSLFGEAGSDLMNGGAGRDACRGGQGKNRRTSCET